MHTGWTEGSRCRSGTDRFLQAVAIECDGWRPDDNYFHLLPGELKRLAFVPLPGRGRTFTAHLAPLNAAAFTVRFPGDADAS
jgi:beta-mannosidase